MACYVLLPPFDIVGTVWDGRMTLIGCECATSQVSFLLPAHHHLWRSGWTPMKSPPEPVQQLSAVRAAVNKDSEENPSRAWNPGSAGIQDQLESRDNDKKIPPSRVNDSLTCCGHGVPWDPRLNRNQRGVSRVLKYTLKWTLKTFHRSYRMY